VSKLPAADARRKPLTALPQKIGNWSLTSLQQRLVKTGADWSSTPGTTGCCWPKAI
jgi:hypothetical protein